MLVKILRKLFFYLGRKQYIDDLVKNIDSFTYLNLSHKHMQKLSKNIKFRK